MINSKEFKKIEISYFKRIKQIFKKRLLFYCVTGSTARLQNITDWSDVDIIMVFDILETEDLLKLNNEILNLKSNIKIGTTCYSEEDIRSRLIDAKTANMIRNLNVKKYKPRIDILNIREVLNIDDKFVLELNKMEFSKDMHVFRREIMKGCNLDEKKTYKTLTYLIRVLIFNYGYIVDGYFETWQKVSELKWANNDMVIFPPDILSDTVDFESRRKIYDFWYSFIQQHKDILNK